MLHLTYHRATRTPTINFQNASCTSLKHFLCSENLKVQSLFYACCQMKYKILSNPLLPYRPSNIRPVRVLYFEPKYNVETGKK